jgi:hypothetical protein
MPPRSTFKPSVNIKGFGTNRNCAQSFFLGSFHSASVLTSKRSGCKYIAALLDGFAHWQLLTGNSTVCFGDTALINPELSLKAFTLSRCVFANSVGEIPYSAVGPVVHTVFKNHVTTHAFCLVSSTCKYWTTTRLYFVLHFVLHVN